MKHAMEVLERYYRSCRRDKVMSLRYIDSLTAQQLLCARITVDMRSPVTCCASGYQLVGDELLERMRIKLFRAQQYGVIDVKFFLFRLTNVYD